MANSQFEQFFWTKHKFPVLLDCNFIVDSTNGNGLGQRSLSGQGVDNVFMHTTASFAGNTHTNFVIDGIASGTSSLRVGMPISGSGIAAGSTIASITGSGSITSSLATTATASAVTISYSAAGSPNPAAGLLMVQLGENYFRDYGGFSGFVSPLSGSSISISGSSVMTVGNVYVITSLGTSTQANWVAVGLPSSVQAAVGIAFIASVTGSGTGTGTVQAPSITGVLTIEGIGDNNAAFANALASSFGSVNGSSGRRPFLYYQILGATNSTTTTLIPKAPANGSVVSLKFYLSNSSIKIKGE